MVEAKRVYKEAIDLSETSKPEWLQAEMFLCRKEGNFEEAAYYEALFAEIPQAGENEDKVYNLGEINTQQRFIHWVAPAGVARAIEEQIEGRVVVELVVTKEGLPEDVRVIDAEPPDIFEDVALDAVRQFRFAPGTRNGEPVDVRMSFPIDFPLVRIQLDPEKKDRVETARESSEMDQPPRVRMQCLPDYPESAKLNQIEGKVVLKFVVATDGTAKEPEVIMATPCGLFEEATLKAIARYNFEPAQKNGKPVNSTVQRPFLFRLDTKKLSASANEEVSSFVFTNSGIKDFIDFVGDMTGKRFAIDDDVKARVTVESPSTISIDELNKIFKSVLYMTGNAGVDSNTADIPNDTAGNHCLYATEDTPFCLPVPRSVLSND